MAWLGNTLNAAFRLLIHLKAARHWSKESTKEAPKRVRWWESERIIEHINEAICGKRIPVMGAGIASLIEQRYPGRRFARAVSIGCGHGAKEIALVQSGTVEEFHLYELSDVRIEAGRKLAEQAGVQERVIFHNKDGLKSRQPNRFDLVYWSGSLHHMLDVDHAVGWSNEALKPGGLFVMDDFVGPDRMQWSDKMLRLATRVRRALPEKYLRNPYQPSDILPVRMKRPNFIRMMIHDPTECADSSQIIPSVKKWFPDAEIKITGGAIYHLALNGVLHNIDEKKDAHLLDRLLKLDDLCIKINEFHYGVTVAEKRDLKTNEFFDI